MAYNMKHGNSAVPFKELGSSPAKQNIGGDASEALAHWNKYKNKAIDLAKKGKKGLTKVGKGLFKASKKIGPALLNIMPAPLVNPTGEDYTKQQEG